MKKNIIFSAAILLVIIACTLFINDGLIYLTSSLTALFITGIVQGNRSWVMKITRWAKANSRKAQVLITVLQLALVSVGIIAGYNFKKLGYEFSNTTVFVFSAIIVVCFLSVPFLPKRGTIVLPKEVNRQRLLFMGIALSSFVMTVVLGNRIEALYPNSLITRAVKSIDQTVFGNNSNFDASSYNVASDNIRQKNSNQRLNRGAGLATLASFTTIDKETTAGKKLSRLEKKQLKMMEKYRFAYAAGLSAGAILLTLLLAVTTCAGICLVVGGAIAIGSGELLGILALLVGGLITWQSVKGIGKVSKRDKQRNK